jgi:NADH:ubiquinone oxidoreductase subunit 5 (subunit L)/multisubunit Na+/H+ antiporter MnhA subunit
MTHAFFKALLFLGSGSVIHAMAGEQDMRRMGGLKKYLPVTYATMMIGTLAIAGIPPLAGFFSKDEILLKAFEKSVPIYVIAAATALMTAFYMFRLVYMTFDGGYRGPAWDAAGHAPAIPDVASPKDIRTAAVHGAPHPADAHAHGHAHEDDHEVAHGPAEPHDDDHSHGHGPWHGPHESPSPMTFPLMALAVGAIVAGFVGVPAALGGGNAIEQFLEPSFSADSGLRIADSTAAIRNQKSEIRNEEAPSVSRIEEFSLMGFSVLIAVAGIGLAHKFYVASPDISDQLAERWAGAHRTLSNKYYVDELYDATVISGTYSAGRGLWTFDRKVVDGMVNGAGWTTIISSWFSGLTDKHVVDGLVNFIGRTCEEGSFWFRKIQTGLVQNYALWMLAGIFAFVSIYLFVR